MYIIFCIPAPGIQPSSMATASFSATVEPARLAAYAQVADKSVLASFNELDRLATLQPFLIYFFLLS